MWCCTFSAVRTWQRGGRENVVHKPEFPKPQNNEAIDVDLVPGVRKVGVPRKPMMVVVQPFTEGEDRGHQLVGRAIIELIATVTIATAAVADRIHQRGGHGHDVAAEQ